MNDKDKIKKLEKQVRKLSGQLKKFRRRNRVNKNIITRVTRFFKTVFVGPSLEKSILNTVGDFNVNKRITKENFSQLSANLIKRFTRVRLIMLIIGVLPILLLYCQNELIKKQTIIFKQQTNKIDQQTHLLEASRRSSQVFLLGETLSDLNKELETKEKNKTLSNTLVGRIIGLSKAMKPYKFYENGELIKTPLSPERGQLLLTLVASKIDTVFFKDEILSKCDFSYADLENANLENAVLGEANLFKANMKGVIANNISFIGTNLDSANLSSSFMKKSKFAFTNLKGTNLQNSNLEDAMLTQSNAYGILLDKANLTNASIVNVQMQNASLKKTNLTNSRITSPKFTNADLTNVILTNTSFSFIMAPDFRNAKVSGVNWLKESLKNKETMNFADVILKYYNTEEYQKNGITKYRLKYKYPRFMEADTDLDFKSFQEWKKLNKIN